MDREARAVYLVEQYADMVTRLAYTWMGNPYDAQDICQNVLLKLMEREEFASAEQERAWTIRVAVNECKNLRRSAWFRHTVGLEEGEQTAVQLPERDEDGILSQVQRLPFKYRQVVYLHYYEGYQVKEIAGLLGQSPNLVSTHLARARGKLKTLLGGQSDEQFV